MIKVLEQRLATPVTRQTKKNLLPIVEHVTKKVSERDIFLFRQYLFSKKFELKMDQDELKKIFELDGDEFFNASFDLIYKNYRYIFFVILLQKFQKFFQSFG